MLQMAYFYSKNHSRFESLSFKKDKVEKKLRFKVYFAW